LTALHPRTLNSPLSAGVSVTLVALQVGMAVADDAVIAGGDA
jgi:hypothetical protein